MKVIPVFIAVFLLSGCIALPIAHDARRTATVYGTVRDATTGVSIPDAQVQIANVPEDPTKPVLTAKVQSSPDGRFSVDVRERRGWYVQFLLGDFFGKCVSRLSVSKAGYSTYTEDLSGSGDPYIDGNPCAGLKMQRDIALQKLPDQ